MSKKLDAAIDALVDALAEKPELLRSLPITHLHSSPAACNARRDM
jgi:hypothetical protein